MKNIYGNCFFNLAATGFPNGKKGIFGHRNPSLLFDNIQSPGSDRKVVCYILDATEWINQVDTAPLNTRAWVFQERLLSPRTLHFGNLQLF
jgi:Heterokaryon incompatibility protein (HET)